MVLRITVTLGCIVLCEEAHRGESTLTPRTSGSFLWEIVCEQILQAQRHFLHFPGTLLPLASLRRTPSSQPLPTAALGVGGHSLGLPNVQLPVREVRARGAQVPTRQRPGSQGSGTGVGWVENRGLGSQAVAACAAQAPTRDRVRHPDVARRRQVERWPWRSWRPRRGSCCAGCGASCCPLRPARVAIAGWPMRSSSKTWTAMGMVWWTSWSSEKG